MSTPPWWRRDGDDLILSLHLQPGARRSGPAGRHGEALKLRIAAPPVEGKANQALRRYLARTLGLRQNQVVIEQGELSREKRIRLLGAAGVTGILRDWDVI